MAIAGCLLVQTLKIFVILMFAGCTKQNLPRTMK